MANEGGNLGSMRWTLQRSAPGKMEIQVVVEEESRLSLEVKGAIDNLIRAVMAEDEVGGYLMPPGKSIGGAGAGAGGRPPVSNPIKAYRKRIGGSEDEDLEDLEVQR